GRGPRVLRRSVRLTATPTRSCRVHPSRYVTVEPVGDEPEGDRVGVSAGGYTRADETEAPCRTSDRRLRGVERYRPHDGPSGCRGWRAGCRRRPGRGRAGFARRETVAGPHCDRYRRRGELLRG